MVTQDWRRGWESYLTIYENFVQLPTNKGYRILNLLNKNNVFDSKNDMFAEAAGYIRTNEGGVTSQNTAIIIETKMIIQNL